MNDFKQQLEKRLYIYAVEIVKFTSNLRATKAPFALIDQILRSGTSVTANIIEARSASSKRDYVNFYNHALKSANETLFWLKLLVDAGIARKDERLDRLTNETLEITKILATSVVTMKKSLKI